LTKNKYISVLIAAVILLITVVRIPVGGEIRAFLEYSTRCGIVFIFAVYLFKINVWVSLLLILSLFAHTVPWFVLSDYTLLHSQQSYIALDWMVFGCVLYFVLLEADTETMLNMMCIAALIQSCMLFLQLCEFDPYRLFGMTSNLSPTALMANSNETSAFLAICSIAFFRKMWVWGLIVILPAIVLVGDSNGALGFLAAVCIYQYIKLGQKVFWVYAVVLALGIYTIYLDYHATGFSFITERLYIWKKSIQLTFENQPLLGFGLGNWKNVNAQIMEYGGGYRGVNMWTRVHNTFVQGYVEMGIGFVFLMVGFITAILLKCKDRIIRYDARLPLAALGAIFVCCNANSLFRMNVINGVFVIIWISILQKRGVI